MMESSDGEVKPMMIRMLKALMDRIDAMEEQRREAGSVSRETENLRRNQKGMLEIKNTVAGMKNAFDGLSSRLMGMAEERAL